MKSQASWVLVCINLVRALAHPVDVESNVEVVPNSHHGSFSGDDVYKALKYNYGGEYKFDGDVQNIDYNPVHKNEHVGVHDVSGQNKELDKQLNNDNINLEWSDQYKILSDKTLDNDFNKYVMEQLAKYNVQHNEHANEDGSKHKEHGHDDKTKNKDKNFSFEYGVNIETDLLNNKHITNHHDSHQKDEHNKKPHHDNSHNHNQNDHHDHHKHKDHHQEQNIHKVFKLDKYLHGHYDDFFKNMKNYRHKVGKKIFIRIPVPVTIPKIYTVRVPKPYPVTIIKPVYYPVIKRIHIPIPAEEWEKLHHNQQVPQKHDTHVVGELQHLS